VSQPLPSARVLYLGASGLADIDDETLARGLIEGQRQAQREVWRRYAPMVRRILRRALGPGHDVDDLMQEAFLSLFEAGRRLREPQALKAYVIAIASRTARGELRKRWVRRWVKLLPGGDLDEETANAARAVVPDPEAREALRRFYRLLDKLGAETRAAFVLRFMEELEVTEVAAALGISLSTAKRRVARAWERMVLLVEREPALVHYLAENAPRDDESDGRLT
jgi:RNA polymerase sigma-70 factor (ECF subfamily)